jgi:hypothetical protein
MNNIEILTSNEIQEIAYRSAVLVQKGWKLVPFWEISKEEQDAVKHDDKKYKNVWIKDGATRETNFGSINWNKITLTFFDLEDAWDHENP